VSQGRVLAGVALVAIIMALATGRDPLIRLSYVLVGVLLVSGVLSLVSTRWVEVTRTTRSRRAEVGSLAEESFTVRNRSWLPKLWLEVTDESELPGHHASRVVSAIGPGESRSWTVRTLCRERGAFTLGPMTLSSGDPLGMFRREVRLDQTAQFVVYPMSVPLRGLDLSTGYLSGGPVVRRRAQFATTNVRGVRAYQPGDAFNRIHWPTTARRGRLFTKEFELDPIADIWILLDMDRHGHSGEALVPDDEPHGPLPWIERPELKLPPTTEEYAVCAAASLARHFLEQDKSVGLIAYGQRRVVLRPDRGERQVAKILGHLAVIRARGRSGIAEVLATESQEFTRHATLVVVTPTTTLRWVEALRELKLRGVRSFVALIEPSTFGGPSASSLGVLTALAANGITTRMIKNGDDVGSALLG
jgi:uncharacterized protein (DUF58 family)